MAYYSFIAIADKAMGIPDPMVLLDTGVNVFTAETDDLDGLLKRLRNMGVMVTKVHRLDDHQEVTLKDLPILPTDSVQPPILDNGHEED